MMADLLIRAGMNDHLVIGDLVAPGAGPGWASRRPALAQLVADAHVAAARPVLADHARAAGIPYVVDPDTSLLQSSVDPEDRWVKLPFAAAEAVSPGDLELDSVVHAAVEFQVEAGATSIVPPYFYASAPDDPWFGHSLTSIAKTAEYLSSNNMPLPLLPIFCAQLQAFGQPMAWGVGIDKFASVARDCGSTSLALCLSPAGAGGDGYGKVMRLFQTAIRARRLGLRTFAWRQGIYGLGLVAAGLDGYECGLGIGEQTNVARRQSSRTPRQDGSPRSGGGGGSGIYFDVLGRSVPRRVGQVLLGSVAMRPKVMCDVEACCPSVAATLDESRRHAVRARARALAELAEQPHARWRLSQIARQAKAAATLAAQANRLLAEEGVKQQIKARNLESLARAVEHLAEAEPGSQTA